jgi:hypothetical protein
VYIFFNLPFSLLLVCVFFAIFLACLTVDIQTPYSIQELMQDEVAHDRSSSETNCSQLLLSMVIFSPLKKDIPEQAPSRLMITRAHT